MGFKFEWHIKKGALFYIQNAKKLWCYFSSPYRNNFYMGSDSCRGWYGCIFPRDAGKNWYMLLQYNSIYYGYLLLLLLKYVTCETTMVILVFVTGLQSWFISCCIRNWMTRQNFGLVYAWYHHYFMLDEYGIQFFFFVCMCQWQ